MGKFLDQFKARYGSYSFSYGDGGCETCGYGAPEMISDSDYQDMLREMDKWVSETFPQNQDGN